MNATKSSNLLQSISLSYQASPLPSWWQQIKHDLISFAPAKWQELWSTADRRLGIHIDQQQLNFYRTQKTDTTEIGNLWLQDPELIQNLDKRLALQTASASILLLDAKQVLRRRLQFPLAAEGKLREVLNFEIDRQTPYSPDQVYFEYRVLERNPQTKQCLVEIIVVSKALLEQKLQQLGAIASHISGVDVLDDKKQLLNINLLPEHLRSQKTAKHGWQHWALALGSVVLLISTMQLMLNNRQNALEEWTDKVAKAKVQARQASVFRQQIQRANDADVFLKTLRTSKPSILALLNDLTQRIPDDTALDKISVNEERLVLVGQSKQAAALVGQLQGSALLQGPALAGAVQPDSRTNRDRFTLTATVGAGQKQVQNGRP
jgi:general secretion pathway protein L